jgi:DNA-binding CsgD family transcriptional regulator
LPDVDIDACDLTVREREVVDVIGTGQLSDREIAETLFIAPATAATHVKNILRKTGLNSRRDLLLLALTKDR